MYSINWKNKTEKKKKKQTTLLMTHTAKAFIVKMSYVPKKKKVYGNLL